MAPYAKRPDTIVHEAEPFNAEPSRDALAASALTPADTFYARNHGAIPHVAAPDGWRLQVGGLVERPLELTLAELRDGRFPEREVVATLQCAGNRREALQAVRELPGELPWGPGAIGTAAWRGVALADVLGAAGPRGGARHAGFAGTDDSVETQTPEPYGASIPLAKAEGPEVLLAYAMNGEPLPPAHGGPLRVVVPGYVGARSVKWVDRIELRAEPWDGYYQAVAYRLLPADATPGPGAGISLGEVALTSEILTPAPGAAVAAGAVEVRGYAFAGDRAVARVDVSSDGGGTWAQAELLDDLGRWAWRLWRARVELPAGEHEIVARAWDGAAATQPEHPAPLWNPKGYVNTAWPRVRVRAQPAEGAEAGGA